MLKIGKDSWHYRAYKYWYNVRYEQELYLHRHYERPLPEIKEDLCHYCRVVFIWSPLTWFVYRKYKGAPPLVWTLATALILLIILLTIFMFWVVASVVVGLLVVFGIALLYEHFKQKPIYFSMPRPAEASTLTLAWNWLKTMKHKTICPFIEMPQE